AAARRARTPAFRAVTSPASPDRRDGEQALARRADLDLGAHLRADAAVIARRPAAVLDLGGAGGVDRVLPVLPQPLAVQARVEVIPRQHLVLVALPGGVPVEVHRLVGQRLLAGAHPPVEG